MITTYGGQITLEINRFVNFVTLTYGQALYYYRCTLHYACQFKNKIKLKSMNVQLSKMYFCIYIYSENFTYEYYINIPSMKFPLFCSEIVLVS